MSKFTDYLKHLRSSGKSYFSLEEAMKSLGVSKDAVLSVVYRLKKKGDLISPAKGLYVIVPPEHFKLGCIPAEELMPILAKHLGLNYYTALLTAGVYHEATHQKPNSFQVICDKRIRHKSELGHIRIDFIYKKSLANLPINQIVVRTGYLNVSSPELTVMDLLLYPEKSGGLNHIATVLSEITLNAKEVIRLAEKYKSKSWLQRLGYLIDKIGQDSDKENFTNRSVSEKASKYLSLQKIEFTPLASEIPKKGYARCKKWKIIENTTIESDL
jgi:predicted transcriptional regulator of viral defense system